MAPTFRREGIDWYCNAGLPSDVTILLDGVKLHLHKFPLVSRCGRVAKACETASSEIQNVGLRGFPVGVETFLTAAKFCYGFRVEITLRNVLKLHSAGEYLEMTSEFGDENLLCRCENFLHKNVLPNWKNSIAVLQTAHPSMADGSAVKKCITAVAVMSATDLSSFGWPMMMYGTTQSPGGSILWNGVKTGVCIPSADVSCWWYDDVSLLNLHVYERMVIAMRKRGIKQENLFGSLMHYSRKHLPGLDRWLGGRTGRTGLIMSDNLTEEKLFLERIVKLLPEKNEGFFCRFLLGLLRFGLILQADKKCVGLLEERIGKVLEEATVDGLLIPTYSDVDTLYDVECVERMIGHYLNSADEPNRIGRVAKLVDNFMAEIAADPNLKPGKIRFLAGLLPDWSRSLHDGLYRVIDVYLAEHTWLSESEKEVLCNLVDYDKLSLEACEHASQNDRLPMRATFQVLFFEQMQFRRMISRSLPGTDPAGDGSRSNDTFRVNMEDLRSRVNEIEIEVNSIRDEIKKVKKQSNFASSPRCFSGRLGCKRLPATAGGLSGYGDTGGASQVLRHRRSFN